ncbi:hypothetical protein [Maribacter forsetii]|uniref:hypothetical protein n=1 Tax=Maribacter forsetii TaxID=444515 RepID=UPI0012FAA6CF|nr:hypothetical protein [Maribacter forsetii]
MKVTRYNLLLPLILLSFNLAICQGMITINNSEVATRIGTSQEQLNYFSQQSNAALLPSEINVTNTGIFIQQIGNNNYSDITTQSTISDVQLNQFGNNNNIDLKLKAEIIDYSVTQNGNNNTLIEYNTFNNKQLLERTVEQNGNGQNLVIEGSNSIVDKMRISMDNGSQSLIIRTVN